MPSLCLLIAMLGAPSHAGDPDYDPEDLPVGSSQASSAQDSPVFRAAEGIVIQVPLDTASTLNGSYPIDSAGYVKLPVLGRLYVNGKTASEVETYLGQKLSSYLKDTHITASPAIRLTLIGYWQKPGMLYVDPEASVWEACRLVGGPAGEINLDKWKVMRGNSIVGVSLLNEFSKGSTLRTAGIRSGDIFVIPVPNPQSGFWYWFRESLTATSEFATIVTAGLTAYLTYLLVNDRLNNK